MQACVNLGGTISGEHGIGLEKLDAMHMIFSDDDVAAQRLIQTAFDSTNVLNPGKVIPRSKKTELEAHWKNVNLAPASHPALPGENEFKNLF